ncbi:MAG: integrase [Collinsella tanakaei]|nr:MAG: integrase [Collinsella tanakaei]
MEEKRITETNVTAYTAYLKRIERSNNTIEKYRRDVLSFARWLNNRSVDCKNVVEWKQYLLQKGYAPATINSMLIAVNRFFDFMGWADCKVNTLKLQKRLFREEKRDLTKEEYGRLINTAVVNGKERLALLMETICATGIRVSEVQYITVEAAQQGRTEISLKGKIRTILLPGKLCKKLLKYAKKQKTVSGEIFLTRNGTGLSRKQIWAEMKAICRAAGVACSKVFPHNLRHLFAKTFYRVTHDVAKLADLLGHSSIETTRIYLLSTGSEHEMLINKLKLII